MTISTQRNHEGGPATNGPTTHPTILMADVDKFRPIKQLSGAIDELHDSNSRSDTIKSEFFELLLYLVYSSIVSILLHAFGLLPYIVLGLTFLPTTASGIVQSLVGFATAVFGLVLYYARGGQ